MLMEAVESSVVYRRRSGGLGWRGVLRTLEPLPKRLIRLVSLILTCISHYGLPSARLRVRCQISSVRSDLIYIIVLGLCLLFSPAVTPVITSNVILPMEVGVTGTDNYQSLGGVVGKRVELPCGITPIRRDDTVYMVLWFRGEESIPIYSLDVRGKPFTGAKHWSAETPFGKRAHFRTVSEPARLVVDEVKVEDQGVYRCRVDFRNSPSRETRLNLTIAVPPEEPLIFESSGLSLRGEVGPYREGSTLDLTCIVRDGVPSPLVYWYLNEELVDSTFHVENDREVINHISVPNIQRSHHRAQLVCRAWNTLLLPPASKTVSVELNLRPLTVSLLQRHTQLSTDVQYEITCESWGSHPQPSITWWLDSQELKGAKTEDSRSSNTSVSRLLLIPTSSIDGQLLTCRSENPLLPGSAIEDSWLLKVVYAPVLSLRMGSSLNPHDIKEGDDVYFECLIKANPPVHKLSWFHNGELLSHNRSAGIILSNQSLVLQRVSRPSGGNYTCKSFNQQGAGFSNQVVLEIMYAPACQSELLSGTDGGSIIIAASRSEDVNISCEMDALPSSLKFHWTHTSTVGESTELGPDSFSSLGSRSLLQYHLRSEEDFGTLLCWASNSIGTAEKPCVYQLVPADIPQPVENCSIINRTSTSVEITCEAGADGGLPQVFILEAFQSAPSGRRGLQFNISSSTSPTFSLTGLDADGMFHFKIYSANRKGRSSPSIMDGIALHYPAMQSAKAKDFQRTTIALMIGSGSAVALAFVGLIAFIIHRRMHPLMPSSVNIDKSYNRGSRRSSTQDELYHNSSKKPPDSLMEIPFNSTQEYDEDGDPDLIPSKNVKTGSGGGKTYSRLSNGEINQRYGNASGTAAGANGEGIPLRSLDPDISFSTMDPQAMANYATFRGSKPNGLGSLKKRGSQQMVDVSSFGTLHGKPSAMVVSIDSRLIGQQLASNQLPESCV